MNFNHLLLLQIPLLLLVLKPAKGCDHTLGDDDVSLSNFTNIPASTLNVVTIQVKVTYDEKFKNHIKSQGKSAEQFVKDMFVELNKIAALPGLGIDLRYERYPTISYYRDGVVMILPNATQDEFIRAKPADFAAGKWPWVPHHPEPDIDHYLFLTNNDAFNQNFGFTASHPCSPLTCGLRDADDYPNARASFISKFNNAYQAARILIAQNMFSLFSEPSGCILSCYDYNYDDFTYPHTTGTINGKDCTGIGGVMDNVDKTGMLQDVIATRWSPCSKALMASALNYKYNCYDFTSNKCG